MADDEGLDSALIAELFRPPSLLPIAQIEDALLYTIETYPVTVLIGETGSGKTTQIPQFLYRAGWTSDGSVIAVTQPRRVAASSVAIRVAGEMECDVGQEVGYAVRFEDVTSEKTRIKFSTDGLLLREMLVDPLLKRYSVIMVDEAHERSLSSDILLGLLKKILKKREDLRVIVSSATLNAQDFLDFFSPRPGEKINGKSKEEYGKIVSIEGRVHPVEINYLVEPTADYIERAVETVMKIHANEPEGDILVFVTGREDIDNAIDMIADHMADIQRGAQQLLPLPLYAGLSSEQQLEVFQPAPESTRKVILSTNIAEASVTIDGIAYVIDCGFVKLRAYDPTTGIERLATVPISKASAVQRSGRAGRTRSGKCYRLYTEEAFAHLKDATPPEIHRSNLAPVILQLMNLGIQDIAHFDFYSAPPSELVLRAIDMLYSLGTISQEAKLTRPLGERMAELPLDPMLGKALLNAANHGVLYEMLHIAAMLSLQGTAWISHDGNRKQLDHAKLHFAADEGDHLTLLNVYEAFISTGKKEAKWCHTHMLNYKSMTRAVSIRNQLKRHLERLGVHESALLGPNVLRAGGAASIPQEQKIRRCLTTGFFAHAARMKSDGSFVTANGETVLWAHTTSVMVHRKADWVIYHEILESKGKIYIRDISKIEMDWLVEYAPEYYKVRQR